MSCLDRRKKSNSLISNCTAAIILSSFSTILNKNKHCQSRDHLIRHQHFAIKGPSSPCVYLAPLWRYGASKIMVVTSLTFWGHVTSSVMWPFDSLEPSSYGWSIETGRLTKLFTSGHGRHFFLILNSVVVPTSTVEYLILAKIFNFLTPVSYTHLTLPTKRIV